MKAVSEEVRRMTENPRQAIRAMSIPLTVAALVGYIQNFIDTAWCAGLGSSELSALSLSGPLYWIIIDVGVGLGVGAATSVARSLGAKNKERADSLASQSVVLGIITALVLTGILVLICNPVISYMADGGETKYCKEYLYPYYIFIIPIVLHGVVCGLIRAEGSGKKVLKLSLASAAINLVIDPVFIYTLDMGLSGAAVATGISYVVSLAIALFWYLDGRMYVRLTFRKFRIKFDEMKDILTVGLPHILELTAISVLMIPQNMFVMRAGGEEGIVLAMTPFKFIMLAMMPSEGLAGAMIPVTSATQGAWDFTKTRDGFMYTIKLATLVCVLLSVVLIVLADPLMYLFTYSGDMTDYHDKLVDILRLYAFITVWGGLTRVFSGILQSLRKSMLATISTFSRELLFIGMYWIAADISMEAIYYCMFFGMLAGAVMIGVLAMACVRNMPVNY